MTANAEQGLKAMGLSLLIFFTLIGNTFVIVVLFYRMPRLLSKPLYLFICNICVADVLATLLTMTFEVSEEIKREWIFGEIACKAIEYVEMSLFGVNIFIHLFIALERYRCVVQPLKPRMPLKIAKKFVIFSWCLPFIVSLPHLYTLGLRRLENKLLMCTSLAMPLLWLDKLILSVELLGVFLIPLFLMMFLYYLIVRKLYQRETRVNEALPQSGRNTLHRAAIHGSRISVIVAAVFLICWVPFILVYFARLFNGTESINRTSKLFVVALYSSFVSELLTPILYCAFDRNIKPILYDCIRCRLRFDHAEDNSPEKMTTTL